MDDILDNLGPIALGVIYFLGWLFSKINKTDDNSSDSDRDGDYEAEEKEYQRNIQPQNHTQPITERARPNPTPIPNLSRQNQLVESEGAGDFSWDQSDDSYDNEMEVQLKKIEATKREAALLLSQSAQKGIQPKGGIDNPKTVSKKSAFRSVRSSLKDSKAARSAFIYGEVLGPPVSLRKGTGVPGLTS